MFLSCVVSSHYFAVFLTIFPVAHRILPHGQRSPQETRSHSHNPHASPAELTP